MQTIETKYLPVTNTRPARIKATHTGSSTSVTISIHELENLVVVEQSDDQIHMTAAMRLCQKLNWTGKLIGGTTSKGMAWVFDDKNSPSFSL